MERSLNDYLFVEMLWKTTGPMFRKGGRDHSDLVYVGQIFMSSCVGMLRWDGNLQGPKCGEEIYGGPCLVERCG